MCITKQTLKPSYHREHQWDRRKPLYGAVFRDVGSGLHEAHDEPLGEDLMTFVAGTTRLGDFVEDIWSTST